MGEGLLSYQIGCTTPKLILYSLHLMSVHFSLSFAFVFIIV
jgi:hypothetical protein